MAGAGGEDGEPGHEGADERLRRCAGDLQGTQAPAVEAAGHQGRRPHDGAQAEVPQHRADIEFRAQVRRRCDRRTGLMRRRRERDPDAGRRRPRGGGGAGGAPVRELQRLKGVNVKLITACTAIKQIDADPICIFAADGGGVVGYGAPEGAKLLLSGPANKLRRHSGLIQATR